MRSLETNRGYFVHFVTSCVAVIQKVFWCTFLVRATHSGKLLNISDRSEATSRICSNKHFSPNKSYPGCSYGPKKTTVKHKNTICPPQIHQDEMEDYPNLDGVLQGFQQYLQNKICSGCPYWPQEIIKLHQDHLLSSTYPSGWDGGLPQSWWSSWILESTSIMLSTRIKSVTAS